MKWEYIHEDVWSEGGNGGLKFDWRKKKDFFLTRTERAKKDGWTREEFFNHNLKFIRFFSFTFISLFYVFILDFTR